jgi:hypothetical protein
MPWLDTNMTTVTSNGILGSHLATRTSVQSRFHAGDEWVTNNLLLNGLTRTKNNGWPVLQPSVTELDQLGYHRIAGLLQRLPKAADPIAAAFTLLKILTLARDMG